MPLQPNSMLGPYQIVGILGEGGMGAVYRARDTRLGRDVAIKVITNLSTGDAERIARFEQEARATGMLNHPNLLTVFDVGHDQNMPYLVSELLEGESLRSRLERGPLSPRKAVDAAQQAAQGLAAAHEKGVVHRDLKPDNIFLTRDGRVKILDFGIAKLTAPAGSDGPSFAMAATEPGMVLGTVGYMSPEQVRGEPVDHRSDIFSFGAIVYEMLTGSRAFKRNSSIETLGAILKDDPPDLTDVLPGIPPALERLVRRCLEKDRDQRFQSARDLAFNLETLSTIATTSGSLSGSGARATGASMPMPMPTGSSTAPTMTIRRDPAATPAPTAARTTAASPTSATSARPRTTAMLTKPKRRISPVLLALFYLASVAGAAWGAWKWSTRKTEEAPEVRFERMTFRRGEVRGARFSADGETIVYSAAWDGRPSEIFVASRNATEARPFGLQDAEVLAVSKTEAAILLRRDRLSGLGTLARVPLAGGVPRELADGVLQADWSPDGTNLAIIRVTGGKSRLEYPIGTVKYETVHEIRDVRVSPDGGRVAFIERMKGENHIAVVERAAPVAIANGWPRGATGLAWRPDGNEIWLTGTSTSAPPSLWAVDFHGQTRLVSRLTGFMKLFDISPRGDVLLANGNWRAALILGNVAEAQERDMAWLDWSVLADVSADAKTILFNETREGAGSKPAVYLRRIDQPAPIRIGDGIGEALSPDGKWAISRVGPKLVLLPTGAGMTRELKVDGPFGNAGAWLPDSRRVVVDGGEGESYRLYLVDTLDEKKTPISPVNIADGGGTVRTFAVSPDGTRVAGLDGEAKIVIYTIEPGTPTPVAGAEAGEIPLQWSADGASLFVYRPTALPAQVTRIDLATGARTLWREFTPADLAGVYRVAPIMITPDATGYAYNALRSVNDLYVGVGLR
jgi:eukaryotic-like serine/threonine-protein kinase